MPTKEEKYLELFKIGDGKYIIGIYQEGITVYKQQMRALNIFHALAETKKIRLGEDFSIAVIGGGIAGLTFAATALKSNVSVTLFEKESNYLHMQSGCDTRKIHPNIYDWPERGSNFPNARLPVLSWTHDTASNVVKQILKGVSEIKKEIENSKHVEAPGLFNEHLNCKIFQIKRPQKNTQGKFTIIHGDPKVKSFCHLIVYAVGYGIEKKLDHSDAPSYWRNDALAQSILNDKRKFLISGTGDGGLIDLCRIKIRDFSYDRILTLLKSSPNKYESLVFHLMKIKEKGKKSAELPEDFYDNEFNQLPENFYRYLYEGLEKDIVTENEVILQNDKPVEHALNFKKISMLNAFLAYILKRKKYFTYLNGSLEYKDNAYYINGKPVKDMEFIIRHGTDKEKVTEHLQLTRKEKQKLTELVAAQKGAGIIDNCWTFDSISKCFMAGSKNPAYNVLKYEKRSEYLTPDTKTICLSQSIILAKTIQHVHHKKEDFRLALHRVTQFDGEWFFQQITPYHGTKTPDGYGCYQNVYSIDHGIVGEAVKTGRSLLIKRSDEPEFEKVLHGLNLHKAHHGNYVPKSFLAIPILAPVSDKKADGSATNLVFYMDAGSVDFFDEDGVHGLIISSLNGLITYIENILEQQLITMSEREFKPAALTEPAPAAYRAGSCFFDLTETMTKFYPFKTNLKFKEFYSFDIIYNK